MFRSDSSFSLRSKLSTILALVVLLPISGCGSGDRIDFGGRVTKKDGSPLAGARVTFRAPKTGASASGVTDQDGHYELGGTRVGEGVMPGEYEIVVNEMRYRDGKSIPPTVALKYINPKTSGLKFTVEPGGERTFDIVLDPY